MNIQKLTKIIDKMKKDQLKSCLLAIVENLPEAEQYVLMAEKSNDKSALSKDIVNKIADIIGRYSGRYGISESRFSSLCRELARYRNLADQLMVIEKYYQAMEIYFAIVNIAEELINSTDAEGMELCTILRDIRTILMEEYSFDGCPEDIIVLKNKILSVIEEYDNNYGGLDFY